MRFTIGARLTSGKPGTLPADRKVLSPQPVITGRVAVHLTFATTPATGLASFDGAGRSRFSKAIAIAGRAVPAIAGERVELRWARVGGRSNVLRAAAPPVRASDPTALPRALDPARPAATSCGRATSAPARRSSPTTPARGCCASCAANGSRPARRRSPAAGCATVEPAPAGVARAEDLAGRRAEVQLELGALAGAVEGLAQDLQVRVALGAARRRAASSVAPASRVSQTSTLAVRA